MRRYQKPECEFLVCQGDVRTDPITESTNKVPFVPPEDATEIQDVESIL